MIRNGIWFQSPVNILPFGRLTVGQAEHKSHGRANFALLHIPILSCLVYISRSINLNSWQCEAGDAKH
jgi:hypothetical protein